MAPLLELRDLTKAYGSAVVLDRVGVSFHSGEIHALVGENGAGKSTLIRCCTGLLKPDGGALFWEGLPLRLLGPQDVRRLGIRAVYQEAEFFPELSLAENLLHAVGRVPGHRFWLDWKEARRQADQDLKELSLGLPVVGPAASLSVGQRMMAEIAAAVARKSRLLFLDEPTASLSTSESEALFARLVSLKGQGVAIVYVSHRLDEVLRLGDRLTVLRDGRVVATGPRRDFNRTRLVEAMVGRPLTAAASTRRPAGNQEGLLSVEGLSDPEGRFRDITLTIRSGEILALYGLVGAGRSEWARALVGLRKFTGKLTLREKPYAPKGPADALASGVALLSEDRRTEGIFPSHPCRENLTAPWLGTLAEGGFFSIFRERIEAQACAKKRELRLRHIEAPVETLSGGNQQKLLLGRWLATDPELLIVDEPTRGVDIGAKAEIHAELRAVAARGAAVVVISSDLPEVLQLGDRIGVVREGSLSGILSPGEATEARVLGLALPGAKDLGAPKDPGPQGFAGRALREAGVFGAVLVLGIALTLMCGRRFASTENILDVLAAAALVSIGAAGAAQVLIVGGIDISVGSLLGLTGAIACTASLHGWPPFVVLLLGMGLGAGLGVSNAAAAYRGGIHPIVVTLAGIYIFRGLMLRFTGGYEVGGLSDGFRALAEGRIVGIPKVVGIAALVHVGNAWFLAKTLPGRHLYAVGGSARAALLAGIRPFSSQLLAFGVSGALIGLTSVLWGAYYGKIQSNTGVGFELQVIAAAVVGGCSVSGGRGNALGVATGSILIAVIYNALILLKVSGTWQGVLVGGLILAATGLDGWFQRRVQGGLP